MLDFVNSLICFLVDLASVNGIVFLNEGTHPL